MPCFLQRVRMDKKKERDAKRTITMKTKLNLLLITAAGLTLSAVAAYGQTRVVANVPFSFRTAAGVQPAGEYRIATVANDGAVAVLQNTETGRSTLTGMGSPSGNPNDKTPHLVFRCGTESGCTEGSMVDIATMIVRTFRDIVIAKV